MKYEYLTRDGNVIKTGKLNELGVLGWELIGYYESMDVAVFKREIDVNETKENIAPFVMKNTYEDDAVFVQCRGAKQFNNPCLGNPCIDFDFVVENKTDEDLTMNVLEIKANGYFVKEIEGLAYGLGGKRKVFESISLDLIGGDESLDNCEIYSLNELKELSFVLEIMYGDVSYESREVLISVKELSYLEEKN